MGNLITIIVSVLTTVIAYFITKYFDNKREGKNEKRKEKMTVFKTLMAKRGAYNDYLTVEALNSIAVIFADSSKVIRSWNEYHNALNISDNLPTEEQKVRLNEAEDKFIRLLEIMASDLGYKDTVVWTDIKDSYLPRWMSNDAIARKAYNELLINANHKPQNGQAKCKNYEPIKEEAHNG